MNLDFIEKQFRDTPLNSKKHAIRLTKYIDALLSKGRVLEAKYHFALLEKIKPNHRHTITLGYSIAISSFDNEGVKEFDKKLYLSHPSDIEICWFRLKYYTSVQSIKNIEEHCEFLLSKKLPIEYLSTVLDACIKNNNYYIAKLICHYMKRNRIAVKRHGLDAIKRITLQKFVDCIVTVKKL